MTDKDDLKRKRDLDQRVASLALVVDQSIAKRGECLSSEEMAAFLDGACAAEQQQSFLEHFSSCDSCYREWLELSLELTKEQKAAPRMFLFRRKFLTVSGSLLAAAASVVFYLNLGQVPGPQKELLLIAPQLEMQGGLEQNDVPVRQNKMKSVAPAPASAPVAAPAPAKKVSSQLFEMKAESIKVRERQRAEGPAMDAVAMGVAADPLQQWLQRVEKSCEEGVLDAIIWKELALQGEELLITVQSPHFLAVKGVVAKMAAGQDQLDMCDEIKRILQENSRD